MTMLYCPECKAEYSDNERDYWAPIGVPVCECGCALVRVAVTPRILHNHDLKKGKE